MVAASLRASTAVRLVLIVSVATGDLAGCAHGGNMFSSKVDTGDSCGVQHRDFADSQNYYMSEAAQGAIAGALGGAALGALAAAVTGGNVGRGAAIGAGAGAVSGAYAGYWNAKQKDYKDQAQLSQSIYSDVRKASTEMDRVDHTFALLWQCRREQSALIKAEFKSGKLTRDQAVAQLADHQKRFKDELDLARKYGAKMNEQQQSFTVAANNLAQNDPAAQQALNNPHRGTSGSASGGGTAGGYTVNTAANVRKTPDPNGERVTGLYAGAAVQVTGPAQNGWRPIAFNGQQGYILDKFLTAPGQALPSSGSGTATASTGTGTAPATGSTASATGSASAGSASAASTATPANTNVAVAQNVTETIPEKREHYSKSVDDADKQSAIAFNIDQSGGAS